MRLRLRKSMTDARHLSDPMIEESFDEPDGDLLLDRSHWALLL